MQRENKKNIFIFLLVGIVYLALCRFGIAISSYSNNIAYIWPASGFSFFAMYAWGFPMAIAVFLGDITSSFIISKMPLSTSLIFGLGNSLSALIAVFFLQKIIRKKKVDFQNTRSTISFILFSVFLLPAIAAFFGIIGLFVGNLGDKTVLITTLRIWFLSDAVGVIALTPILMLTTHYSIIKIKLQRNRLRYFLLISYITLIYIIFFSPVFKFLEFYNITLFLFPVLLWIALRSNTFSMNIAIFFSILLSIFGTLMGGGPFASNPLHEALMMLQLFILIIISSIFILHSVMMELVSIKNALKKIIKNQTKDLRQKNRKLTILNRYDDLTKIYNRRYFKELAEQEFYRAKRYGRDLAFLMIDIDFFKKVNDNYGHPAGDEVLRELSKILKSLIRKSDILGRLGGEEFGLLLPEINIQDAYNVAEKIRIIIQKMDIFYENMKINITISIGLAVINSDIKSLERLIKNSDKALYISKESNRNRVTIYTPEKT